MSWEVIIDTEEDYVHESGIGTIEEVGELITEALTERPAENVLTVHITKKDE